MIDCTPNILGGFSLLSSSRFSRRAEAWQDASAETAAQWGTTCIWKQAAQPFCFKNRSGVSLFLSRSPFFTLLQPQCLRMHFGWGGVFVVLVDRCDRACMWGVYGCKSACHIRGAPAGVFMDRQPFFRPRVSISLWDSTPSFCCSLCEICSPPHLLCESTMNSSSCVFLPHWLQPLLPSFHPSLLFLFISALPLSAPAPVVPPPLGRSFPRWENRDGEGAAGQPEDRRTNGTFSAFCLMIMMSCDSCFLKRRELFVQLETMATLVLWILIGLRKLRSSLGVRSKLMKYQGIEIYTSCTKANKFLIESLRKNIKQ